MNSLQIRPANLEEIPILARHHRRMFEDMWQQKNDRLEPSLARQLESAYQRKLEQQIPEGIYRSWVAEENGGILASGAVTVVSHLPVPIDLNPWMAYIHTIFTEREHRGRGCARRIIEAIIEDCKGRGIRGVILNASAEGRPIYEQIGFQPALDMMRLWIET
ncbi:MAG: GNAT family N-acetyltransferase [Desulfobacteraceae bacterium]|nr:GNAT family N-acetyltransferase [Desulfobacteraceae bacterium]